MNLQKELKNNQILLSIFSKEHYNESIIETVKSLKENKIYYITLKTNKN